MKHSASSGYLRPHATHTAHSNFLDLPAIIILCIVPTSTGSRPEPKQPRVNESSGSPPEPKRPRVYESGGSPPEPKRPRVNESGGSPPEPKRPRVNENGGSPPEFKMDSDVSSGSGKWWRGVLLQFHFSLNLFAKYLHPQKHYLAICH